MSGFASAWAELAKSERARHHQVWGTHIEPSLPNFRQNGELSPKAKMLHDMLSDAEEVSMDELKAAVGLHRSTVNLILHGLGAECHRIAYDGKKKQGFWRLRDVD